MSFEIFFQPCRFGKVATQRANPFTGQSNKILPNEPLTTIELDRVRSVLEKSKAVAPQEAGFFDIQVEDGGSAQVFCKRLEQGCMVDLHGITPGILQFLFDLLQAGDWVMIPAMQETRVIATSTDAFRHTPKGYPPKVVCESPAELGVLLSGGFDIWKKYRDQVVEG